MSQRAADVAARSSAWVVLVGTILAGSMLTAPARAQSNDPGIGPDDTAGQVIADGPFGRVAGVVLAGDPELPEPGTLPALDAYGRGARIDLRPAVGTLAEWRVVAYPEPPLASVPWTELGSGTDADTARIRFPSTGMFLVRLDATVHDPRTPATSDDTGSWVWRIAVPDRDLPSEGEPYLPVPTIELASGDRKVGLEVGSGCYVGTCGDIGATSPPRTLPTLETLAGAPLVIRLSDGSGIAAWVVDATPVDGTTDQTHVLATGAADPSATAITVAAPPEGRWVILVHVRFDRDRGSFDGYGRLILAPAPGASMGDVTSE